MTLANSRFTNRLTVKNLFNAAMKLELIFSTILALITVYSVNQTNSFVSKIEAETFNDTYTFVDQMPQIIGGVKVLYDEIEALQEQESQGIMCSIFLEFTVQTNGSVSEANSLSSNHNGCDNLAITALKKVEFKPGYHKEEAVPVLTTMPLKFMMKK